MKKFFNLVGYSLILGLIVSFNSCKEDDENVKALREGNSIVEFSIPSLDLIGEVDSLSATVTLTIAPDKVGLLKDVVPAIKLSPSAKITPAPTEPQDFTVEVKYTVSSESGVNRVWTVKSVADEFVSFGIGTITEGWQKTAAEAGLSANQEATLAVSGNTIVFGRTGLLLNGLTGEPLAEKLNMTGVHCSTNDAYNIAFTVANDGAGNVIGCTLGAWGAGIPATEPYNSFKIYKWASPTDNPVEIISHEQSADHHYGRKLTAVGNINSGKAIVTSFDVKSGGERVNGVVINGAAAHAYWEINNGVVSEAKKIFTNFNSADLHQILWPVSPDGITPFYFSDLGSANADPVTTLQYNDGSMFTKLPKGPVPDSEIEGGGNSMFKETGYGRKILYSLLFDFNNRKYLAVLSYYNTGETTFTYYVTILDTQKNNEPVFLGKKTYEGDFGKINGNSTAGLAVSQTVENDRTKTMKLYAVLTSSGIISFDISNVAQ